ncbi:MAG TPA: permease-like cell division protein FtsX [Candidatus Bipolaricaulota bacterium]|nr:permease-like cell division protein FtsX [Candidatus Bipolaricaulota bacterium]
MFVAAFRIIKFAVQDFYRNIWLSLVTVSILTLALLSVNVLILMNAMTDEVISSVQDKIDVSVFFTESASQAEIENLSAKLREAPQVKEVVFVSKEEALEKFKEKHQDDQKINETLSEIGENPLLNSIIVKANSADDYDAVLALLENPDFEDLIQDKDFADHRLIIDRINSVTGKVERFGLAMSAIFGLIAVLIVYNAIRVIIYTHKEEIGVMRLVGATNWFIRTPFLISSIIYAVLSVVLSVVILYPLLGLMQPYFSNLLADYGFDLLTYFNSHFFVIFGLELLGAVFLTIFSSGLAISKYLKV